MSNKARRLGETVLVLCIAAILMGVWIHGSADTSVLSHAAAKKTETVTIAKAIRSYAVEHGEYPRVVDGLPFCQPFNIYNGNLCLGDLIGEYLQVEEINLTESDLVYMDKGEYVLIAADVPVDQGVATNNRCDVSGIEFWCIKLYR